MSAPSQRAVVAMRRALITGNQSVRKLSDSYRAVLREYEDRVAGGAKLGKEWRVATRTALNFLGGQGDRNAHSLANYQHDRFGPFLGVSDEGGAAVSIRSASEHTPKAPVCSSSLRLT